ncbi:MAG: PH domain-containing protein, partial [Planctomycetes bacterium]|nr:PH domain-containing protein [Planctomycetota bacterium]
GVRRFVTAAARAGSAFSWILRRSAATKRWRSKGMVEDPDNRDESPERESPYAETGASTPHVDLFSQTSAPPAAEEVASLFDASHEFGERRSLSPAKLRADYLVHTIQTGIVGAVGVVAFGVQWLTDPNGPRGWIGGAGLVALAVLKFGSDAFSRAVYRRTSYRVGALGLEIRRGVLWRSVINVPTSRVQHTDVARGPIERLYGLATLVVHTAGTVNATIHLAGLDAARALRLRDRLIADESRDDAV